MVKMPRWTVLIGCAVFVAIVGSGCGSSAAPASNSSTQPAKPPAGNTQSPQPTAAQSPAAKPAAPAQAAPVADKLLTIADVEKVSGLTGIKLVDRDPSKGAGGDLNFAMPDGSLVVMLNTLNQRNYDDSKKQPGAVKEQVSGVGDDAWSGPADDNSWAMKGPDGHAIQVAFSFRKGTQGVSMATFLKTGTAQPYLSQDQLRELAKSILSRM